jgi:glutamine cyclotransferase
MPKLVSLASVLIAGTVALGAQGKQTVPPGISKAPQQTFTVVRSYPHDPKAFTQGLEFFGGVLYESTGLIGRSSVRKLDLETGKVIQEVPLQRDYFGEGMTITAGKLFQLTWRDRTGFVYDANTLKFIRNFAYFGEGWGLTHEPGALIMSDGTSTLRFLELTRFQERRRVKVTDGGVPIERLNELEWVRGEVWANVWETDYIVRISPKDGRVLGWINLKGLMGGPAAKLSPEAVLNGIAYDAQKGRIFVTGKLWPRLFEIQVK